MGDPSLGERSKPLPLREAHLGNRFSFASAQLVDKSQLVAADTRWRAGHVNSRGATFRAVSLFSNCGAGDLGFRRAGFVFDIMAELDWRRLHVALLNHPEAAGIPGDLRKTWPTVVQTYRQTAGSERPALLAACPPCQGVSSARGRRGHERDAEAGSRDERNLLVDVIASVSRALRPRVVVVENVPAFLTRHVRHPKTGKGVSAAVLLIESLAADYAYFPLLTDLADYGVPQTRKRAFLTFVHRDESCLSWLQHQARAPYPRPTTSPRPGGRGHVTLGEALARLGAAPLDARDKVTARDPDGHPFHFVPVWRDRRYPMVAAIPPNSGASAWENDRCERCGSVAVGAVDAVCPQCGGPLLRPVVPGEDGTWRLIRGFQTSSYTRMRADMPASTITTASGHVGSHRTIHPSQNRLLSLLECAHLQTFPSSFKWGNALQRWGATNVRAMIGEAVPPIFTGRHGRLVARLLADQRAMTAIGIDDERVNKARKSLELQQTRYEQLSLEANCP
jgi:DNA (cytosine-5)-methyltransferase 1